MVIAGVDEVGRGPLAGPLVTAAVILNNPIKGLKDSKLLTPRQRCILAESIKKSAICFAIGRAEVDEIAELNIHHATLLAMRRAIDGLTIKPDKILIDGIYAPQLPIPCYPIPKGDVYINDISAASILAKVVRDAEMISLDKLYPQYGFAKHKGYATKEHRTAIKSYGPCPIHRKGFGSLL